MARICWLASYPKSGNTWTRAFLTHYFGAAQADRAADQTPRLHDLIAEPLADHRTIFDHAVGLPSCELSDAQIDRFRHIVHAHLCAGARPPDTPFFMKTHNRLRTADGTPLFFLQSTERAVVLIRNPLDVAISFAHHSDDTIAEIVRYLAKPDMQLARVKNAGTPKLAQPVGSWSAFNRDWADNDAFPTLVLRYEDLLSDPQATFTSLIAFAGCDPDPVRVAQSIKATAFDKLKRAEAASASLLASADGRAFFRKGKANDWQGRLTRDQIKEIMSDHAEIMDRFGYLAPAQAWCALND